jgi:hypothetical protein
MRYLGVVVFPLIFTGLCRVARAQDLTREHGFRFPVGLETSMTNNSGRVSGGVGVYGGIQYSWVRAFSFGLTGGYTPRINGDTCYELDVYPPIISCEHTSLFRVAMQAEIAPFRHAAIDPFASAEMGIFSVGAIDEEGSGVHVGLTLGAHVWLIDDALSVDPAVRIFYIDRNSGVGEASPVWFAFGLGFTPRAHSHAATHQ